MSTQKSTRFRNFACVVYPDSANTSDNWLDIVDNWHVNCLISPLHDKDINPDHNEPKKPHFHLMVCFESVKTCDQVKELFDQIGGVGLEIIQNLRNYARYLCHLDNPDKYQYDPDQVRVFGFDDYRSIIGLPSDKYKMIKEMIEFSSSNNVEYFCDLLEYARLYREDWFRSLCDNSSFVMGQYFKSRDARSRKRAYLSSLENQEECSYE